ncbi:MAG: hypothetical protein LBV12_01595 [Puniceicoccales bacterium]|jgi:hypothetical protein|nr:hypothetical protein [Puniceicoccales bacterium]
MNSYLLNKTTWLFFYLAILPSMLLAENNGPVDAAKAFHDKLPLICQANRPFSSLSVNFHEEDSKDGGKTWEKVGYHEINWDINKKNYSYARVSKLKEDFRSRVEKYSYNGELTIMDTFFKKTPSDDFSKYQFALAKPNFVEIRQYYPDAAFEHFFNVYKVGAMSFYTLMGELLKDPSFMQMVKSISLKKIDGKEIFEVVTNIGQVLTIDATTGCLLSKIVKVPLPNGKSWDSFRSSLEGFVSRDGYYFPKIMHYQVLEQDGKALTWTRFIFDPDSIKINHPIDPVVFKPIIPVGAQVRDEVRGITYRETGISEDGSAEHISKSLDKIVEAASKQ